MNAETHHHDLATITDAIGRLGDAARNSSTSVVTLTTAVPSRARKRRAGKDHPTPKAPQNQSKAAANLQPVEPQAVELTPEQAARLAAAERYRAFRRKTRPYRRAFALPTSERFALSRATVRAYDRDARTVRDAVILGARTVADVACASGLKQGRVRRIVEAEGIQAVTS